MDVRGDAGAFLFLRLGHVREDTPPLVLRQADRVGLALLEPLGHVVERPGDGPDFPEGVRHTASYRKVALREPSRRRHQGADVPEHEHLAHDPRGDEDQHRRDRGVEDVRLDRAVRR